jgi:hypothetical protein
MTTQKLHAILAFALALGASGCSKGDDSRADAHASASPIASAAADAVARPAVPAESSAPSAAKASASPAYTDIAGVNGETQIDGFATLGVLDPKSGAFDPGTPVKRREFVRWLVKANNVLWADTPAKRIDLADTTEKSAFHDVATSDPDFPYIQGMQDAGYSVGFPDGTFRPDGILTREQMFAIENTFDRGSVDPGLVKGLDFARNTAMPPWKDKASISKTYVAAIATGANGGGDNFALVYGSSSLFHPQFPVTRAQAAVAVSSIGDHTFYGSGRRTVATALAAAAAASPSPAAPAAPSPTP